MKKVLLYILVVFISLSIIFFGVYFLLNKDKKIEQSKSSSSQYCKTLYNFFDWYFKEQKIITDSKMFDCELAQYNRDGSVLLEIKLKPESPYYNDYLKEVEKYKDENFRPPMYYYFVSNNPQIIANLADLNNAYIKDNSSYKLIDKDELAKIFDINKIFK